MTESLSFIIGCKHIALIIALYAGICVCVRAGIFGVLSACAGLRVNNAAVKIMTRRLSNRGLFIVAAEALTFFNRYTGLSAGCIGFFSNINLVVKCRKNFRLIRAAATGTLLNALSAALCRNHYLPFAVGVRELVGKLCLFSVTKGAFCILNAVGCAGCRNGSYCAGIGVILCRNVCNLCTAVNALDFSAGGAVKNNLTHLMSSCRNIFSSYITAVYTCKLLCTYLCACCSFSDFFVVVMEKSRNNFNSFLFAANTTSVYNAADSTTSGSGICCLIIVSRCLLDSICFTDSADSNGNNAVCIAGRLGGNSCTCEVFNVCADINGFNSAANRAGQSENTCCAVIAFTPGMLV